MESHETRSFCVVVPCPDSLVFLPLPAYFQPRKALKNVSETIWNKVEVSRKGFCPTSWASVFLQIGHYMHHKESNLSTFCGYYTVPNIMAVSLSHAPFGVGAKGLPLESRAQDAARRLSQAAAFTGATCSLYAPVPTTYSRGLPALSGASTLQRVASNPPGRQGFTQFGHYMNLKESLLSIFAAITLLTICCLFSFSQTQ